MHSSLKKYLPIIIFSILLTCGCRSYNYVEIDGEKIIVEISRTEKEKQRGLMFRKNLCRNCGMLFIFEEEGRRSFWMKNTFIPLDMVFIDADLTVVDILHAVPCTEDPCRLYTPRQKALYVLETNGNKFNEKIIGKKVKIFIKQMHTTY